MIKLVILKNEIDDSHKKWQLSCENYGKPKLIEKHNWKIKVVVVHALKC